jgi:hypothetical protein
MQLTFAAENGRRSCLFWQQKARQTKMCLIEMDFAVQFSSGLVCALACHRA